MFVVARGSCAVDDQNPLAILAADAKAGFEDRWKYQDTGSLAPELLGAFGFCSTNLCSVALASALISSADAAWLTRGAARIDAIIRRTRQDALSRVFMGKASPCNRCKSRA